MRRRPTLTSESETPEALRPHRPKPQNRQSETLRPDTLYTPKPFPDNSFETLTVMDSSI